MTPIYAWTSSNQGGNGCGKAEEESHHGCQPFEERTVIALGDEELRRLVTEGRESGEPVEGEAVLDRLRAKYAAMTPEQNR